ncbi:ribonuclease HIII [Metabacillus herbersteinensis]|uniref:Ribonuclease HIII n=1 Tax=Metabacillus herbersteinensis TaxID=283816 RepID=A0ABV6GBE0_9BACI
MGHAVIKVDNSTIKKMEKQYASFLSVKVPPGAVFTAKLTGCTITAYRSGKVLFQGQAAEIESGKWGTQKEEPQKKALQKQTFSRYQPPTNIATMSIIGSDEVGTGDFFGPITVVAAYVKKEQLLLLQELGVKDSKHLKDPQIIKIAENLIHTIPYSLLVLNNEKYNQLQQKGMSQGKMKALLHNQAIQHLLKKLDPEKPEGMLIDQFVDPAIYFKHLQGKTFQTEHTYFSTKAEGIHLAVAAASIIARYSFVKEFDKLSLTAGVTIPKGAGAKVDQVAAEIIRLKGIDFLTTLTKKHFANTEKAIRLSR